jgi:hypothetical protein
MVYIDLGLLLWLAVVVGVGVGAFLLCFCNAFSCCCKSSLLVGTVANSIEVQNVEESVSTPI